MTQHAYAFLGSRLHLVLEEKIADGYNRFVDAFDKAQFDYRKDNGFPWNPSSPLEIDCTPEDNAAWNAVGSIINLMCEVNGTGLDIPQAECTSVYLVRI
jgi:hypothetical protein